MESAWNKTLKEASSKYCAPTVPSSTQLDAILYINLAHREDRRASIEKTIDAIRHLTKHVERIDAVKHANGGKGCAQSHLKAFERIQDSDWDTVLILEDDAVLDMSVFELEEKLQHALSQPFDVTVCGSEIYDASMDEVTESSVPLTTAQCTTAYIIRKSYVPVLSHVWAFCDQNLGPKMDRQEYRHFAIDQGWKKLIPLHNWRWLTGNAFRQYPNFSDIEHKKVNYKWHARKLT